MTIGAGQCGDHWGSHGHQVSEKELLDHVMKTEAVKERPENRPEGSDHVVTCWSHDQVYYLCCIRFNLSSKFLAIFLTVNMTSPHQI